jgi:HNH endonuclease
MARVPKTLADEVRVRAHHRCEYCCMPQVFELATFQIEHIVAAQHHGPMTMTNLALACLRCNKRKGPNLSGRDPITGKNVWLFNPREQKWGRHFYWNGPYLVGRTQVGRATIETLAINLSFAVEARRALMEEGKFPPREG